MLEYGRDFSRWRPHLELLYHICGKWPVVLGDEHFEVFGSQTGRGFIGETEAVRQWKILSRGLTLHRRGQQWLHGWGYGWGYGLHRWRPPTLLDAPSPLFPHDTFNPADPPTQLNHADPPTQLDGLCVRWVYRTYASMVAFSVFNWLSDGGYLTFSRDWSSRCPASAAFRRVYQLLAAPPSDAAQWGKGMAVFDKKYKDRWHLRLVVLGSEAVGEGHTAGIQLADWGDERRVNVYTTESAPHDRTRNAVMRVLGRQLGDKVWREESEYGCVIM
ncbi:unnamed protein product [Vitrella brassicaformis CCMP3155]|uniref:Uncharacterized protein n=1 Tax=Vitrella brassicaformis (strain CCMP3155) TaxID=1169540 RepID=A0A0G4F6M7_VITBC|nr:unnamed protein product [Vitrella brassicaformis CCMP3155]|eukprot:CEM07772.1 unnamed protein product [Vitrella brassicaformis CCMP3155]